jgi:hypothetical protein
MAAASARTAFDVYPLSVAGLERLMERLPAAVRAQLAWSPAEFRAAFLSFVDGPKDEASLQRLVGELMRQLRMMPTALSSSSRRLTC